VWQIDGQSGTVADFPLFNQPFVWTLPLPPKPTAVTLRELLPSPVGARRDAPTPPAGRISLDACVDWARSNHYMRQYMRRLDLDRARGVRTRSHGDLERASDWMSAAVAASPPATLYAQFLRLSLAGLYHRIGDRGREG